MSYGPPKFLRRGTASRSSRKTPHRQLFSTGVKGQYVSPSKSLKLEHDSRRLRERFEMLLQGRMSNGGTNLDALRRLILLEGLPPETENERVTCTTKCSLRGKVWKILLGLRKVDAANYISIISRGPSKHEEKIDNDLHRTLASNKEFSSRVSQAALCRLLNGYVNAKELSHRHDKRTYGGKAVPVKKQQLDMTYYVQGMNVLAAPFLYVMTEVDAFFAYERFLSNHCPRYVKKSLVGAHDGHKLVDMVLRACDAELYDFLSKQQLSSEMTLFPTILSFSVNRQPMSQVLKLWDVLLAYGVHLNIVFIVAQLILIRDLIFANSPGGNQKMINKGHGLPPLKASLIISLSMHLLRKIPDDLYAQILLHPFQRLEGAYSIVHDNFPSSIDLLASS